MTEKELRLALVCYGGVSLAVYMFGVTSEILKLVRASKAYHSVPDVAARAGLSYAGLAGERDDPPDTEEIYFGLLREIGGWLDLRVIVDVISGASAGGVNGVLLAHALANELPVPGLRDMWLVEGDIARLLAKNRRARTWSKAVLRPLIWAYTKRMVPGDPEMRAKLSAFLRSRWFRPPLDGENLTRVLLTALNSMGEPADEGASLVPAGQRFDLFVTITDFYGYPQYVPIHDPALVIEREHRHVLHFRHERFADGEVVSDFDTGNVPSLAFAARASSSFPGAFPPAQIGEVERVAASLGMDWSARDDFLAGNFRRYRQAGMDPTMTSFVDGSVLNNKPFAQAIEAIQGRPAYRQVDRRLVYIDPDPQQPPPPPDGRAPNWFRTLKGALSDIPRNEPVFDDLAGVEQHNQRVRRRKGIIEASRPQVTALVLELTRGAVGGPLSSDTLGAWREAANAMAARESGFAFDGYIRLKITSVLEYVGRLIADFCGYAAETPPARQVGAVLAEWARIRGINPETGALPRASAAAGAVLPAWIQFILRFDLAFRQRRLRFVIRALNELYGRAGATDFQGLTADKLDGLKSRLYDVLEAMRRREEAGFSSSETAAATAELFSGMDGGRTEDVAAFAARRAPEIDALLDRFAAEIRLNRLTRRVDAIIADVPADWAPAARRELLLAYIGFAFWDVLTFSLAQWRGIGEYEEIRVDRISPDDANTIRPGGAAATLKGVDFNHFGAFFSRRNRENDYLWGRLHAVDRLIDIVCNAAALEVPAGQIDIVALKKRAFETVLSAEEAHLANVPELFASLREEIARIR